VSRDGRLWLVLILAAGIVTAASAQLPFIHDDDPFYALVAKNVAATGDWVTLRHPAYAQVDKPPLTIWLMAVSIRAAGDAPAALRTWHILATFALVWTTYRLARRAAGIDESLLAALILFASLLLQQHTLMPQQDIPLTLFLTLGLLSFYDYRERGRTSDAAGAGLWIALAMLTKGLVGPALFALVVATDLALAAHRSTGHWRWPQVAVGAVAFVLVAAPWFIAGAMRQGTGFVQTFTTGRMGIGRAFQPAFPTLPYGWALLYYLPVLILGFVPWTGMLPATVREIKGHVRGGAAPLYRLCGIWAALTFIALSVAPTDRGVRYLLPILPPLAVLTARAIARLLEAHRGASARWEPRLLMPALASLVLGVLGATAGVRAATAQNPAGANLIPLLQPALMVLSAGLILGGVGFILSRVREAVAVLAAGAVIAQATFTVAATRHWHELWPWETVASTIAERRRPDELVFVVGEIAGERNFAHYYVPAPVQWVEDDAALARARPPGTAFALVAPHFVDRVRSGGWPTVLYRMPSGWLVVTNR
jgi:4-amino-4-deoxy-L-arabinose transferase-like glycosyltransferase